MPAAVEVLGDKIELPEDLVLGREFSADTETRQLDGIDVGSHNPGLLVIPASNQKLLIAAAALKSIEVSPVTRPKRSDWVFVDEKPGFRMGEATVRYSTTVAGGEVTGFREFVHVPEAWSRDYRALRSKNEAAGQVATFGLFVTFVAMLGVSLGAIGWIGGVLPLALTVALTALELLVAFLQAYVFAILTCIYLNDAIHPGH